MSLVPRPPRQRSPLHVPLGALVAIPERTVAVSSPKGVVIDPAKRNELFRSETSARKTLRDSEETGRRDAMFLIALLCAEFRDAARARQAGQVLTCVPSPSLAHVLTHEYVSPTRRTIHVVPERRSDVLKMRGVPSALQSACDEEAELRNWMKTVEQKIFQGTIIEEHDRVVAFHSRFSRCESIETRDRLAISASENEIGVALRKREFLARPPFNRPPKPPPATLHEKEAACRHEIEAQEEEGRKQCHEFLVLRYGVQLFSVNRVEVVYRYEIEEAFDVSLARHVAAFFRVHYRTPILAMAAFHTHAQASTLLLKVSSAMAGMPMRWHRLVV